MESMVISRVSPEAAWAVETGAGAAAGWVVVGGSPAYTKAPNDRIMVRAMTILFIFMLYSLSGLALKRRPVI
jgi:hypothetical protein